MPLTIAHYEHYRMNFLSGKDKGFYSISSYSISEQKMVQTSNSC